MKKITKRELEQNLIETSGSTPEAAMNVQISVDIKNKGQNSALFYEQVDFNNMSNPAGLHR